MCLAIKSHKCHIRSDFTRLFAKGKDTLLRIHHILIINKGTGLQICNNILPSFLSLKTMSKMKKSLGGVRTVRNSFKPHHIGMLGTSPVACRDDGGPLFLIILIGITACCRGFHDDSKIGMKSGKVSGTKRGTRLRWIPFSAKNQLRFSKDIPM